MKKVILNLAFLCAALACFGQGELQVLNDSPDRVYVLVNYHALPLTGCETDATHPAVCLLPSGEFVFPVPTDHVVHSLRVFNANAGCTLADIDWSLDGHLIFPPFPCTPSADLIPYNLTLTPCGISCQKVLIE